VAALLDAQAAVYRDRFHWDVSESWAAIEPARQGGRLPGLVATDRQQRAVGLACFLRHRDILQTAVLASGTPAVTRILLAAIDASSEARQATSAALCLPETAPGLREALSGAGYAVEPYLYMAAPVGDAPADAGLDAWRVEDYPATADLAARAYAGQGALRAFALDGTADEWREYIATLVAGSGCGRLRPDGSFVVRHPHGIRAAVLATHLGPGTAHIAQLMVDPSAQGQGLGRRLARAVLAHARRSGAARVTLLVAASNARAVDLYESLGFRTQATFLTAVRRQPRRSTSVALATGGASTRR
jgi:ribosomal protein S18 acetylase RimI-like enzyme